MKNLMVTIYSVVIGLTGLTGCGSNNVLVDKSLITKPYVETAFVSDFVAKHGASIKGQVRQDLISINLNDRLSAFVWQNYSHKEKAFNERDYGLTYTFPINDKISIRAGYEYWDYPSGTFGDHDEVLKAGAHYSGTIDLDYDLTQLLPVGPTESGTRHYVKASKTFPIYKKGDLNISLTPSLSTACIDNYYGNSGLSQITPGINMGIVMAKLNINMFINKQLSQNSQIENATWSGMSIG